MKKIYVVFIFLVVAAVSGGIYYKNFLKDKEIHKEHSDTKQLYTCPMHPQIISDKPGSCPICGMDLVPLKDLEKGGEQTPSGLSNVTLMPETAKRLGVSYEQVIVKDIVREIRSTAEINIDETRIYRVSPKIDGWVEKLFVNQTGQYVKKGEPLLTIYSQELFAAQEEYLAAIKAEERFNKQEHLKTAVSSLRQAAKERLKLLDMTDHEIEELEKTKKAKRTVTVYAPYSGYVMERMVNEGQKVMSTDVLMTIVDLSRVWGLISLYQPDLPYVKVGAHAEVIIPYGHKKGYRGKVTFIDPFVNPDTRTVRARLEIENNDLGLKPKLLAEAVIRHILPRRLAVPESAVIRTGTREYVFVKTGENELKPVLVETGVQSGDGYMEVLSGLKKGDEVVTSANFLIDSESQLKAALKAVTEQRATTAGESKEKIEKKLETGHEGHTR